MYHKDSVWALLNHCPIYTVKDFLNYKSTDNEKKLQNVYVLFLFDKYLFQNKWHVHYFQTKYEHKIRETSCKIYACVITGIVIINIHMKTNYTTRSKSSVKLRSYTYIMIILTDINIHS